MDIKQINQAIMFSDLTNDELMSVIDAVKWKRATLAKLTKASLKVGDNVNFTSSKTGMNVWRCDQDRYQIRHGQDHTGCLAGASQYAD